MTDTNAEHGELISALLDGEVSAVELGRAVDAAGDSSQGLAVWHSYHVVGETLRGQAPSVRNADALFLTRLRGRLAEEAVALAPRPVPSAAAGPVMPLAGTEGANDAVMRWKFLAGAASLAAVAVMGWHVASLQTPSEILAAAPVQGDPSSAVTAPGAVAVSASGAAPAPVPQVMLRDARLDALLAAHKQFGGTSALQMPAGFLRNATFDGSER